MPTKIYTYYAKNPLDTSLIEQQIAAARRYYNDLIKIHQERLRYRDDIERIFKPQWAESLAAEAVIQAEIDQLYAEINRHKQRTRTSSVLPELKEQVDAARKRLREQETRSRELRKDQRCNKAMLNAFWDAINRDYYEKAKALYNSTTDLFWGTKNFVAGRVDAACQMVRQFGSLDVPSFRSMHDIDRDTLYCQIIGGIPAIDLYGSDTRVQIAGPPITEVMRRRNHRLVKIRIGSDAKKKPVWAEFLATIGRPLPHNGRVMAAQIVRKAGPARRWSDERRPDGRWAPYYRWEVQFIVRTPDDVVAENDARPVLAIDTGWRMRGDDLRVAVWADSEGNCGELKLAEELIQRWPTSRGLQSVRSKHFDEVRGALGEWLAEREEVPEWLAAAKASLYQWRSEARLSHLVSAWQRMPGDDTIYRLLREWQAQEHHLDQWQDESLSKAQRIRELEFRRFAKWAGEKYSVVVLEDINYAEMRRRAAADQESVDGAVVHWRNVASPGLLVRMIGEKAAKVERLDPAGSTTTCSECGSSQQWDRSILRHTCTGCGATWDQDDNAAKNLLARYFERLRAADEAGPARPPENGVADGVERDEPVSGGRFQRRKAARSKRRAQGPNQ